VETLWLFPVLGAATGWVVVRGAWWLAFRPRRPRRFGPLTLQGFVPARRAEVIEAVTRWVGEAVSLRGSVEKVLGEPHVREELRKAVEERLANLGGGNNGVLGRVLGERLAGRLAAAAGEVAARLLPLVLREVAAGLEERLDLGALVRSKLNEIDDERVEGAFVEHAGPWLRKLGLLGAGAGAVLGLGVAAVAWLLR